ncbi:MAG: glycosyltransferase family 4 protein [Candidatus Woesearchaeota archaeon]
MNGKKQAVLIISTSTKGKGGIASVIRSYQKHQDRLDYDVRYLYTHIDKSSIMKILYFIKSLAIVPRYLLDKRFSVFHIHTASYSSFKRKSTMITLAKRFKKKVILHVHGAEFMKFYKNLDEKKRNNVSKTLDMPDVIIALSEEWKKNLSKICKNKNILVLHNSVELPEKIDRKNSKKKKFLFLGRLGKRKGVYDLIEAFKSIPKDMYHLYLGGDGEIDKIKKIVKESGLDENISVLGWIDGKQKESLLRKADVYVLPSYDEGLPVSVLEAMSYSLPILSTPVGGIPRIVKDKKNGYLVLPGNISMLRERIKELLDNNTSDLGKESYKMIKDNFDIKNTMALLNETYGKLQESA